MTMIDMIRQRWRPRLTQIDTLAASTPKARRRVRRLVGLVKTVQPNFSQVEHAQRIAVGRERAGAERDRALRAKQGR